MLRKGFIIVAAALAACATEPSGETSAAAERDCFRADSVSGYSVIDDHNVRITVGASRRYILGTTWNARDLDWTQVIGIRSNNGWICTGNGLGVDITGGHPRRTYPVTSITREPETPATQS